MSEENPTPPTPPAPLRPTDEVLVIRGNTNDRTPSLGYSVGAAHRGRHLPLTDEPPIGAVGKGPPPTPRTWAHERP
jgi:hypothetical protein